MNDDIPDRVRQILERVGLTQRAAAQAIGIDETKLAKSLNGTRNFRSIELAQLADLGNRTVEWILTGKEPRSMVFAHRSALADRSISTEAGEAQLSLIMERYEGLEAIGMAPSHQPRLETSPDWSYVRGSNELADEAVSRIGFPLSDLSTPALIDAIEETFDVNIVVAPLPEGCDGMSYRSGDFSAIVLATTNVAVRQRYTLAHELAHVLWGDADQGIITETVLGAARDRSEKRADVFAASFLMPKVEIRSLLAGRDPLEAFNDLACRFGVSPRSMAWRMLNLALIDEEARGELAQRTSGQSASAVSRQKEHLARNRRALEPRPPLRLATAAANAYLVGETGIGPTAQLLGLSDDEARRLLASGGEEENNSGNPEE